MPSFMLLSLFEHFYHVPTPLIVVYIDDGICITIGLEEAKRNSEFVRDTLIAAGLVLDVEKSSW